MYFEPIHKDLVSLFQSSREKYHDRPLLGVKEDSAWRWLTYGEVGDLVDAFRGGLASLGVSRGDRVAVISNNRLEWAVGAQAVYGLGAAYVPMYEAQRDDEWAHILVDSGAKVCLAANGSIRARVQRLANDLPALAHVVDFDGGADDPTSFRALAAKGAAAPAPLVTPAPADLAGIFYTSGTTGSPKGVRLTQSNLAHNVAATVTIAPYNEEDRTLSFLPWSHLFGGCTELHGMILVGASLAICSAPEKLVAYLGEVRPTLLFAPPRVWNRLYDGARKKLASDAKATLGELRERFGGRLRFAISGAAALSADVAAFIEGLGITVLEGYGMTEAGSCATCCTVAKRKLGTVGPPLPGVLIAIDKTVEGTGGNDGEVIIYGHGVMEGYHGLPDETAKTKTPDGGIRSGDLGRLDEDGFLVITGRVKELYKLENGRYVAPAPLEEKITLSPYIAQAMLHGSGRPHNVALLVADTAAIGAWAKENGVPEGALLARPEVRSLIASELDTYCKDFRPYERPQDFLLIDEPFTTQADMLTPTLKLKRRNVMKRYGGALEALYGEGGR